MHETWNVPAPVRDMGDFIRESADRNIVIFGCVLIHTTVKAGQCIVHVREAKDHTGIRTGLPSAVN